MSKQSDFKRGDVVKIQRYSGERLALVDGVDERGGVSDVGKLVPSYWIRWIDEYGTNSRWCRATDLITRIEEEDQEAARLIFEFQWESYKESHPEEDWGKWA